MALLILLDAGSASAGGVGIHENGGKRLGSAYAGGAAEADDATTIWWNPAGLTRLRRHQLVGAAHAIFPYVDFDDAGSLDLTGMPMIGNEGGNGSDFVFIPNIFAAFSLNKRLKVGLGINVPFGLVTDFDDRWVGRYHGTHSEIQSVNINPSVAYRLNRCWSVGAGVSAQYFHTELSSAIDFGSLSMGAIAPPQMADGMSTIEGDSWGVGFNVGALYEPCCGTRFGLHYRSRIKHTLDGDAEFAVPSPAVQAGGALVDTGARASVTTPDALSFSAFHRLNKRWSVMADATWTGWSTFDHVDIRFDNPAQATQRLDFDWKNSMRYAVGAEYRANKRWTVRGGIAFDDSPVPTHTRSPRVPDENRVWLTFGVGYRLNACTSIDLGFAHIFVDEADSRLSHPTRGTLLGKYSTTIDIVALQITYDF